MKMVHDHSPQDAQATIRQLEEELAATNREVMLLTLELERRVELRTAQLEEINRDLEAFSYSVSHDLRAPLRHILAFADLLKQQSGEQLDEDGRHLLGRISRSAQQMSELIEGLLRFSRTNRSELQKVPVDLNRLVEEVVRELEIDNQNAIALKVAELPKVSADPLLLRQVLFNVIGNAVKYTRPRVEPRIEIGQISKDRETVIFVRDNGVGFDMKYIDRLFGVFQRLHRESEFEGTGIGLATARKIISRHGGRIWAEAQVDRGATFYIALPFS